MFTGIIEELGRIKGLQKEGSGVRLNVSCKLVVEDASIGDSIAVNGVCLTVVEKSSAGFSADISSETLVRTSLRSLAIGSSVNLERPLSPSSRFGGHIVQGHVDGTGKLISAVPEAGGWQVRIGFPETLSRYIVEKGSITVDGISLTVASLGDNWFEIAIIPHTWEVTNLKGLRPGDAVNLEVDIIAKYVERMITRTQGEELSMERLRELGY